MHGTFANQRTCGELGQPSQRKHALGLGTGICDGITSSSKPRGLSGIMGYHCTRVTPIGLRRGAVFGHDRRAHTSTSSHAR
uniref:Uncharacterized protein n=1 Tax=Knipowitschia caucasica TaxID=637954 RepID=A0AAV2KAC4_KNICA